ncbi:hypothetical protein, partial [uncultured Helicobacter sp.]|uniref:hypothetical protein n=1 Tax=uncultured Helicobacter sp. TaxID=175537 RepID=UPI00263A7A85
KYFTCIKIKLHEDLHTYAVFARYPLAPHLQNAALNLDKSPEHFLPSARKIFLFYNEQTLFS